MINIAHIKRPTFGPPTKPMEITIQELNSLQYLEGYAVKKVYRKIKNCKDYKSAFYQGMIQALEAMTATELEEQKLIKTLTGGGLTALTPDDQNIFKITEEHFRIETLHSFRTIDTKKMIEQLRKDIDLLGFYTNVLIPINITM